MTYGEHNLHLFFKMPSEIFIKPSGLVAFESSDDTKFIDMSMPLSSKRRRSYYMMYMCEENYGSPNHRFPTSWAM
jgi:hypothetical protein